MVARGDYGPVLILRGDHKGTVGYYDDDESGRAVGMLSIDQVERAPLSRRATMLVRERADRDPALLIGQQEEVAHLLEQSAFARVGRAAVIDYQGRPLGVVSITDIQRSIRAAGLRGRTGGSASLVPH